MVMIMFPELWTGSYSGKVRIISSE